MAWLIGIIAFVALYSWVGFAGIVTGVVWVGVGFGVLMGAVIVSGGVSHRKKCRARGDTVGSLWRHIGLDAEESSAQKKAVEQEASPTPNAPTAPATLLKKNASLSIAAQQAGEEKARQIHLAQQSRIALDVLWQNRLAGKNLEPKPATQPAIRAPAQQAGSGGTVATHTRFDNSATAKPEPKKSTGKATSSNTFNRTGLSDRITFLYQNSKGETAERDVTVRAVSGNAQGDPIIDGYCKTAGARRTFRTDRVLGMITRSATGEMLLPDAWLAEVAALPSKKLPVAEIKKQAPSVMFTGFKKIDLERLESHATALDWRIRKTVSQTLDYLVTGDNAGPAKIRDAEGLGIEIIDEDDFLDLMNTEMKAI